MSLRLLLLLALGVASRPTFAADPKPEVLLDLPGSGTDPDKIDYPNLPKLKGEHAVISAPDEKWKFRLHNYLIHHEGKFWCMWSHGPEVEDHPTQEVWFATSPDGLKWSEAKTLTGPPKEGYGYIARDFWLRDGELLALAAHYKGKGAFGVDKDLTLQAFALDKGAWKPRGTVAANAINNYAPQKLSTGEWLMTRRDARFNVFMLRGGVKALDAWESVPVVDRNKAVKEQMFAPDEPVTWPVPGGKDRLAAVIRDNAGSSRAYRTFSADGGKTWGPAVKTNLPNSSSKMYSLPTTGGYRLLIWNGNPKLGRRELHLATSDDGLTFTRMMLLETPSSRAATFQYPHAIEHDGYLYVAYSKLKTSIEIVKVPLSEVAKARK